MGILAFRRRNVIRTRGALSEGAGTGLLALYILHSALDWGSSFGGIALTVCGVAACATAVRMLHAGIAVDVEGINIYAIIWSRSVSWNDIVRFSAEQQWIGHSPRSLVVELTNGKRLRSVAIVFHSAGEERAVLRELAEAKRVASVPSGSSHNPPAHR